MTPNNLMVTFRNAGSLGNAEYSFSDVTPNQVLPLLPGVVALDSVLSMGQIELNCVLKLK